jgi:hypothetical protein
MLLQELDPGIVDGWPTAVPNVIRDAVFGDHDLGRPVLPSNPGKRVVEPTRIDLLPACARGRMGLERLPLTVATTVRAARRGRQRELPSKLRPQDDLASSWPGLFQDQT